MLRIVPSFQRKVNNGKLRVLLLFVLCLCLASCTSSKPLEVNAEMQEKLEARGSEPPRYFPPEKSECLEHVLQMKDCGDTHVGVCRKCGAVMTEAEEHLPVTSEIEGTVILHQKIYVVTMYRCKCGAQTGKTYEALDWDERQVKE